CIGHPDMAVRDDRFIWTVLIDNLPDILSDEVGIEAISGHVAECVGKQFHAMQGRKLVDKEKEPVLVVFLSAALERHLFRQPIDNHGEYQPDEWPQSNLVGGGNYQVERHWTLVVD